MIENGGQPEQRLTRTAANQNGSERYSFLKRLPIAAALVIRLSGWPLLWLAAVVFVIHPAQAAVGWQDLANTKLLSVCPSPSPGGTGSCANVISSWGGAAARTQAGSEQLILWGGGHNDYYGNEVYALNLYPNPPTLTRLTDPSVVTAHDIDPTVNEDAFVSDGMPVSRHTYDDLAYLPGPDRMFSFEGSRMPNGAGGGYTWTLDLSVAPPVWHKMYPTTGSFDPATLYGSVTGAWCAYDPNTDSVICNWGQHFQFLRYTYSNNSWTKLTNSGNSRVPYLSSAVIDPRRQLMLFFGGVDPDTGLLAIKSVDIKSGSAFAVTDITPQTNHTCDGLTQATYPGLAYDSAMDRIVGWPNIGNTVYLFNPDTNICTTQTFANGPHNTPPLANGEGSVFGRFAYFPSLDAFAVVSQGDQDAFLLRLSAGGPQDTTPPTIPAGLSAVAISSFQATLSWSPSTDIVAVAGYRIYRDGSPIAASLTTTFIDSGLVANTKYTYTVAAFDPTVNMSAESLAASATTYPAPTILPTGPIHGLGYSTLTCLDKDGDGYGVGPGCLGPDADDNDAGVHTGAQLIAKYGSLILGLNHLGYTPTNIWYVAPTGSDTAGAVNDPALPFATCCGSGKANPAAGDALVLRGGTYQDWAVAPPNGTAGNPVLLLAYPGELPYINNAGHGNHVAIDAVDKSYIVIDGIKADGGLGTVGCIGGGTSSDSLPVTSNHVIVRNVELFNCYSGIMAFDIFDWTIEDSVFHDMNAANGQHGVYIGAHAVASSKVAVHRNLMYNNPWNDLHVNGRMTGLVIEQNVLYNAENSGISLQEGVSHSVVQSNLIFNTAQPGIEINNYDGDCLTGGHICPYDQNYNVIQNNTIYQTGVDYLTGAASSHAALEVSNSATGQAGDLGHQTIRNNIFVGVGGYYPSVWFQDDNQSYLADSAFAKNIFWNLDGSSSAFGLGLETPCCGAVRYTCAQAASLTNLNGCLNVDPRFTSASAAYWNQTNQFNLTLAPNSPGLGAGIAAGAPTYDIRGALRPSPPSLGAYDTGTIGGAPPSNPGPLPAPQVTFGDVPINQALTVANASAFAGYTIHWTFTSVASNTSSPAASGGGTMDPRQRRSGVTASVAGTVAASGASVQPLSAGLSIGAYQVSVTVVDGNNNVMTSASGQITFVNANLSSLKVYPNPWRSDKHAAHPSIIFDGLTVGTDIKIFTVSGHKVAELHADGPSIPWTLTNDSGDKVASGVYVYLVTDGQGERVRGKIGVIR